MGVPHDLSALTSPRISCVGQRPLYGGEHRMQVGPPPAGSVIEDERRRFDHAACWIWL